jgi:hypothetical protein
MSPHPLDSAWAKFEWAKTHMNTLGAEIRGASDGHPKRIPLGRQYEPDLEAVVYRIEHVPEIRERWSLLLGDAIHDYRCALDHLWWQLAIKHLSREPTQQEAPNIQFPIVRNASDWPNHRFLRHVDSTHAAKVERAQPYHPRQPNVLNALGSLAELSNEDKHRRIHITTWVASQSNYVSPGPERFRDCVPLRQVDGEYQPVIDLTAPSTPPNAGDEVARVLVQPTGSDPDVDLEARLSGYVAIRETWDALTCLEAIDNQVWAILRAFDPLL